MSDHLREPAPTDARPPSRVPLRLGAIPLREKIAYGLGDVGSNLVYFPASAFILFYLTTTAGIGAAIAGTILLIGQLMNGITDLVVGALIDKTSTRWGKARPWILWSTVPLALSSVLLFSVPQTFDDTGKIIWSLVFYTLVMAVFFTASNVAYSTLLSVMTPDSQTRVTLTSFRFFSALLTTLVLSAVTLPLVQALGNDQTAWTTTAALFGTVSIATLLVTFFGTKERVTAVHDATGSAKQPLGSMLRVLFRNKYFLLAALIFVTFNLMTGLWSSASVYYASDVLGDAALFGIISLAGTVPSLIGIPFMPALMGRFGKRRLILIGVGVMFVGALLPVFDPGNFALVMVGLAIRGFGMVPMTAGQLALVADVVDYGEWRNGIRTDGLIYSAVVFGQKVGAGLGAAIVGWILGLGGYVAGAAQQDDGTMQAILAVFIYLPVVMIVATGVVVYFFRVENHASEIRLFLAGHTSAGGPDTPRIS